MALSTADAVHKVLHARQVAEHRFRGHVDHIISTGGRGGGKTTSMQYGCFAHCEELGGEASPVVTREGWGDLVELMNRFYEDAHRVFGGAERNKNDGTIALPSGAVINFTNIGDEVAYARLQGRNFTSLFADEVGNYSPSAYAFLARVRTNIRVPLGRRAVEWWTCNPHGRSHAPIFKSYISRAPAFHPFQDDAGRWCVWTHSTHRDNEHIDREQYRRQLVAGCPDAALAQAWIDGTWGPLGGQMFQFDPSVHLVAHTPTCDYMFRLGGDWGAAAPAACLLLGVVPPDVHGYAPGSVIVLDETDTAADPNDLGIGSGAVPQQFAEMILEMSARHGWRHPHGAMDDARGLQSETVIGIMRENGVNFHKPFKKDRVGQWNLVNQMLANAKSGDGPGLYISNRCAHLIETLAEAPRGALRPEDLDPKWPRDHWCDALGYGLRDVVLNRVTSGRTVGMH
jgi:hypothetical protein